MAKRPKAAAVAEIRNETEAVIDCSNAWTLQLLVKAGATNIRPADVEAWTEAQYTEARAWALEQIEANYNDDPGRHTSIAWPAHVSLAHHGPESGTHTPNDPLRQPPTMNSSYGSEQFPSSSTAAVAPCAPPRGSRRPRGGVDGAT